VNFSLQKILYICKIFIIFENNTKQMKKTIFLILLLTSGISFGQSVKKRIAKGNEFYRLARVREVLDTILWKAEDKIFSQTENFFIEHNLDPNNGWDYEFFQTNIMRQFLFSKRHILEVIRYEYQHRPYQELNRYVNKIKKGKLKTVIYESGLHKMITEMIDKELSLIRDKTVPKYLEIIMKRHEPVDLKLKYNNKPVKAATLDLDVVVITNNADYKRVSILDKEHNKLLKPEDRFTYEQIQKILIVYKGMEFEIKPDERIYNLPRNLMKINNILSDYSFEEIPEWELEIVETPTSVGVKLVNVVEANVVKSKPVSIDSLHKIKN
jgi:hypothetical protein